MSVQNINVKDVLVEQSRFSLKDLLVESNSIETSLEDSLKNLGILHPVILYRDKDGKLHLIDGRKRIHFARQNQIQTVSAIVLPEATPVTDIITLILCDKRLEIEQSIMNKVRFICFALYLKAPESWILNFLCIQFSFKPYSEFLRDCERMNDLPAELKSFCHEKKYSLKQILNLTSYPMDILLQLMAWKPILQLTASTLDEIASNLKDHLRMQNKTINDFLDGPDVQEIIRSSLSPRDRTERLRQLIYTKRFPTLSETNARMQKTVEGLKLPQAVSINWDRTLENKNVDIVVHVQDFKKLAALLSTLNSTETKKAVEEILDEL
ncbi:MAG: ParB N-terminal domain-containing protein [Nitrospirae bacterium]|nr:ParB N-terminal domain-containing protein [Nitrospirota bacterium]